MTETGVETEATLASDCAVMASAWANGAAIVLGIIKENFR